MLNNTQQISLPWRNTRHNNTFGIAYLLADLFSLSTKLECLYNEFILVKLISPAKEWFRKDYKNANLKQTASVSEILPKWQHGFTWSRGDRVTQWFVWPCENTWIFWGARLLPPKVSPVLISVIRIYQSAFSFDFDPLRLTRMKTCLNLRNNWITAAVPRYPKYFSLGHFKDMSSLANLCRN